MKYDFLSLACQICPRDEFELGTTRLPRVFFAFDLHQIQSRGANSMKRVLLSLLTSLAFAAQAGVLPKDLDGSGIAEAFLDPTTGLYWSNANVFGQVSLSKAQTVTASATFEGISNWRLPTVAEFRSLYSSQGHAANGNMIALPFDGVQFLWYWTADVDPTNSSKQTAYSPSANMINYYTNTLSGNGPYTWAVATVPEPSSALLLALGLSLLLGASICQRHRTKIATRAQDLSRADQLQQTAIGGSPQT
jgi:hypothetical protein